LWQFVCEHFVAVLSANSSNRQNKLIMNDLYPKKIYAELTTRCNLRCKMCVKYAAGSCIAEEDLPLAVFKSLAPSLAHAQTLILNGIGEPLLHPDLEEIVEFSRANMPPEATIGFQSNGILLDEEKSVQLILAGLSTVCLSLDSLEDTAEDQGGGHSLTAVSQAIANLVAARRRVAASHFRIGLEMVLSKKNIHELPKLIQWATDHGVDYIITTHLLHYDQSSVELNLFNPNSSEAVDLFNSFNERATNLGINLADCLSSYMKYTKTANDEVVLKLFRELQQESRTRDIRLHLQSLLEYTTDDADKLEQLFATARAVAKHNNIELFLPPHQALPQRICPFITDQAIFIAANGDVMPCHYLWHTYSCRLLDDEIQVTKCSFGTIREQSLQNIWQSPEYSLFRREAGEYNYSSCWSCSQGPCANLVNDNILSANDCFGSQVPCGHCQWNLGGIRCL
jgi:putative metalloenzyme radical SAM/SPASM domain maturase